MHPDPHAGKFAASGPREETAPAASIVLDRARILQRMGYPPASLAQVPSHVAEVVEVACTDAPALIEPRGLWRFAGLEFGDRPGELVCASRRLAVGGIIAGQLRRSRQLAVFVVSIGSGLEREAERRFREGDPAVGHALSAIGSEVVEAWAEVVAGRIAAVAESGGWRWTNRYSPGYCLWDTGDQRTLFELLPPRPAGVTLNEHALMSPLKSVSGIIGLGPEVEYRPYPCDRCGVEDCTHRLVESSGPPAA